MLSLSGFLVVALINQFFGVNNYIDYTCTHPARSPPPVLSLPLFTLPQELGILRKERGGWKRARLCNNFNI